MQKHVFRSLIAIALLAGLFVFLPASRSLAAQAKPGWQQDWEKTLEAAKKEGQVNVYIAGHEGVLPDFEKDHPGIRVNPVIVRGSQLALRLLSERRAEKYLGDVLISGINVTYLQFHTAKGFDPITPALILPEVTDETKWYLNKHQYSDPEGRYVFNYVGSATYGLVGYNTKLVDPKEFKSYWDLVDPKWRGKILIRDVRQGGPGGGNARFFYHHPELGAPFLRKLFGDVHPTLFRDFRQGPDWLAVGKFAICLFCETQQLEQQGLPVDLFEPRVFKEGGGLVQQYGSMGLVNRAPHPNAAKVFINWLLSRRGQIVVQKRTADTDSPADSLRTDIPKDDVPLQNRRLQGIKYLDTGRPEMLDMKPVLAVINEALKAAGKN